MINNIHLVSIIMPTYNSEKYISETVESVLKQTYTNWEILIVDDGSTDNTNLLIQSYISKEPRIKHISLGYNSGKPARGRNVGISNSSGKYIAFLDSDDIWHPDKLEMQVKQMESQKDIGLSYVLYSCLCDDGNIKGIFPRAKRRFRGHIFKPLYRSSFIYNSSIMVRADVFNEIGLLDEDPRLIAGEDYDMLLRISLVRKVDYINSSPLLIYRKRLDSVSKGLLKPLYLNILLANRYIHYSGKALYINKIIMSFISIIKTLCSNLTLHAKKQLQN